MLCVTENGMQAHDRVAVPYAEARRQGHYGYADNRETGYLSCMRVVQGDEELMLISTDGTIRVEIDI